MDSKIYNGILRKKNQDIHLQVTDNNQTLTTSYILNLKDSSSKKIIDRLSTGDFISVQAQNTKDSSQSLTVLSINYVGLNILLGLWLGNDNLCYHFQNFTNLMTYPKNLGESCSKSAMNPNLSKLKKMNYFVNPDDQAWLLLISDKSSQYAAELFIKNEKTIQLNLFDEQTGAILSHSILRR